MRLCQRLVRRRSGAARTLLAHPTKGDTVRKLLVIVPLTALAVAVSAQAAFRGGNGRIAFAMGAGNVDVYSANPDGSGLKQLTTAPGWDGCPAFSPDGKSIAFCSEQGGPSQIWVMNADGSGQRQVSHSPHPAYLPAFSADGRRIAFESNDGGPAAYDIYVVGARGGKITRFTGAPGDDEYAAFSPDGKTIAFVSHRKVGPAQIWLMNATDGRHQRQLTRDPAGKDERPDWSPDGTRIVYVASGNIWVMNADGTAQRSVTRGSAYDFAPVWSPDGKQIAFVRLTGPLKQVYVVNADGSGLHPLERSKIRQLAPSWQPIRR
jgi:Tol biopolymer transport system component